jgi:hypothetical protein
MADLKITDLTAFTDPVNADLLVMVDDVAGTPTTKKITRGNFFDNGVTINNAAGDFDTIVKGDNDALLINTDAANDLVGIGIAPSGAKLHVKATSGSIAKFGDGSSDARFELLRDTGSGAEMQFHAGDAIMSGDGNWQLKTGATHKIKMKNAANGHEVWVDSVTPSIYTGGGDDLIFGYNQSEKFRLTASGLVMNGSFNAELVSIVNSDSPYTAAAVEVIIADATSGAITVNLPDAAGNTGRRYSIKKVDATANLVTIDGDGGDTIDGQTTKVLSDQYDSVTVVSDGTNWFII